jgi:hypothetical protein
MPIFLDLFPQERLNLPLNRFSQQMRICARARQKRRQRSGERELELGLTLEAIVIFTIRGWWRRGQSDHSGFGSLVLFLPGFFPNNLRENDK